MKRVVQRTLLGALVFTVAGVAFALNPPYLSQMPSVEQVRQKIHGSDALDTDGRLVGAYWQLKNMVSWLGGPRRPISSLTPDEQRLQLAYITALDAIKAPRDRATAADPRKRAQWAAAYSRYDHNEDFRNELIRSLFSPRMQIAVNQAVAAEIAAERGGPITTPGGSSPASGRFSSTLTDLFSGLGTTLIEFLIAAYIGYRIYNHFHFSQRNINRRSNRDSMKVFGEGDQSTREHAILRAFDSPDFVFRHNGIVGGGLRRAAYVLLRDIKSFRRGDLESLRFACLAYNRELISDEEFHWFRFNAIHAGGITEPSEAHYVGPLPLFKRQEKAIKTARGSVAGVAARLNTGNLESRALAMIQKFILDQPQEDLWRDMQRRFVEGVHWMTKGELLRSAFAPSQSPYGVSFGLLEGTNTELVYSGEGSIMTIAPPRSGKTQCNVFPNLLRWPGPAVILDVKGEIYEGTSRWRSENVGPVIRFSPLDPARSAAYNPLTAVRRDSLYIWEDSRFLADMMIVPGESKGDNVFWENRAREVLTAVIADVAFWNPPEERPMSKVLSIINRNGWAEFIARLRKNPEVAAMRDEGASLASAEQKTIDGILQTAKSSLGAWVGERIGQVTRKSDWTPLDLRSGANPTLYVCMRPNEIDAYVSLLRVVIAQHIRALTSELPPRGQAPILFMLDELPRLKNMPPVEEAIEIGSQYGIRLWMFAQSLGQMQKAYANADGMIGSCAVRSFMNPSLQDGTAKLVAEQVGEHTGEQHGGKGELAGQIVTPQQLAGPDFKELQIVLGVGSKPAKVRKMYAYQNQALVTQMGALADVRAEAARA